MTIIEYLSHCRSLGINLSIDGERLRINAPKDLLTTALRNELAARKPDILQFLRGTASSEISDAGPIPRSSGNVRIPLSLSQERMWFLDKLLTDGSLYNIKRAYRMKGALNVGALQYALDALVARHESLRTRFVAVDGRPQQIIDPPRPVPVRMVDWSRRDRSDVNRELRSMLLDEARKPYDLSEDLILRALLVRLDRDEHVLFLGLHHIAADGWSIPILLRELSVFYNANVQGICAELPDLPIQYADYALWQHSRLEEHSLQIEAAYWRERLAGVPPLELPTDRTRAAVPSLRGEYQAFAISKDVTSRLKDLARVEHTTLYTILLAAFNALLHRHTGQTDLLIGSPVANRDRRNVESLIGLFVTTLVNRTDCSGNPSFRELVGRVRQWTLDSLMRPEIPFEKLDVWGGGDARNGSLLRTLFVFQNLPASRFALDGLTIERLPSLSIGVAKFDFSLTMRERPPLIVGGFSYATDLFDRQTVVRLADHFRTFLSAASADPDAPIGAIHLLDERERHQMIVGWNETDALIQNRSVHELFEAQARRTPNALAVVDPGAAALETGNRFARRLTYSELDDRAGDLAAQLRARGVGRRALVGICMERSIEMIVSLLGVLKAGAAYLPLDPEYPADRLAVMIEDACPDLLLIQRRLQSRLPNGKTDVLTYEEAAGAGPESVELPAVKSGGVDALEAAVHRVHDEDAIASDGCSASDNDLAYVIFTSGSTGRPKGVMIEHRSLSNLTQQASKAYEISPADRVLQFASISFDTAVEEIFTTLCSGATLVLHDRRTLTSVADFIEFCDRHRLTVLDLPTAFWHELVETMDPSISVLPDSVRLVIIGGERARRDMVARWLGCTRVRLVNSYGPTETTVVTTLHDLTASEEQDESLVPIGTPIGNTRAYVLDSYMNPVPHGARGELYIGGVGVARGYINSPDLTASRFVSNPFGRHANATRRHADATSRHPASSSRDPAAAANADRLYRTGDVVRRRPDGVLEYVGRADDQVKIRGFRVEPGEVETAIRQHPSVEDCVVRLWDGDAGREQLVAYVVARRGTDPSNEELRHSVTTRLPSYMLPSVFMQIDSLPKLPNGKVDRRALPDPDLSERARSAFVAPRSAIEACLADIWADVLGVDHVSIDDNFFELGGHSLLIMRVIARVRERLDRDLPVRCLFDTPTIAGLARTVARTPTSSDALVPPAITAVSREDRSVPRSSLVEDDHEQ